MEDGYQEPRISVSIKRRINLGSYESVDIFMAVSGVEPGATTEEIEELMVTGNRAFEILTGHIGKKIQKIRVARNEADQ